MTTPTFGALLCEMRERAGLSKTQLAERSGYDRSSISRLESGERLASYQGTLNLADALGVSGPDTDRLLIAAHFPPASAPVQALLAAVWAGSWPDANRALAACMDAAEDGQEGGNHAPTT